MDITELSEFEIDGYGMRCMLLLDKGIQRIKSVATWPDDKLPDKIQSVFPKFCEYIAFNMGTLYPFFEVINSFVPADRLFASLCKTDFQREKLSYDEAFEFLLSFPDDYHSFLDSYGKMSSYSQNMMLCSLEERDFSKFSIALDNGDYSDFLCKLSILRYILSGKNQSPDFYGKDSLSIKNEWLSICNWVVYFLDYEDDADFVYKMRDQIIRRIIGIEKIETYLDEMTPGEVDSCEKESDFSDILEFIDNPLLIQKNKMYYEGWFNDWTQLVLNRNACRNIIVELTDDSDYIIRKCQSMSCEIMDMSILSHPKESEQYIRDNYIKYRTLDKLLWRPFNPDEIDQDSIEEVDEYTYSFKIPRLKNHKGVVHSPISHNYISKVEEYLADNRINKWIDTYDNSRFRGDSFGDYVLLMIYKIAEVYNYMTDYLNDNSVESKLLNYIINKSAYKDIILSFAHIYLDDKKNEVSQINHEAIISKPLQNNNEIPSDKPLLSKLEDASVFKGEEDENNDYLNELRSGRLRLNYLQDAICTKYLCNWFSNKIYDVPYLKYIFFGKGKKPVTRMIFIGKKTDLIQFVYFINKERGNDALWNYFNKYVNDKKGKAVFATNPISNLKSRDLDIRKIVIDILDRELTEKEDQDLK